MSKRIFIFITLCKLIENNAPKNKISGDSSPLAGDIERRVIQISMDLCEKRNVCGTFSKAAEYIVTFRYNVTQT